MAVGAGPVGGSLAEVAPAGAAVGEVWLEEEEQEEQEEVDADATAGVVEAPDVLGTLDDGGCAEGLVTSVALDCLGSLARPRWLELVAGRVTGELAALVAEVATMTGGAGLGMGGGGDAPLATTGAFASAPAKALTTGLLGECPDCDPCGGDGRMEYELLTTGTTLVTWCVIRRLIT